VPGVLLAVRRIHERPGLTVALSPCSTCSERHRPHLRIQSLIAFMCVAMLAYFVLLVGWLWR